MNAPLRAETVAVISRSPHTIQASCQEVGISRSSYYRWRRQLAGRAPAPGKRPVANALRERERQTILHEALAQPHLSARQLACWCCDHAGFGVSEYSVRRLLKAHGLLPPRPAEQAPAAKAALSRNSSGLRMLAGPPSWYSLPSRIALRGEALRMGNVAERGMDWTGLPVTASVARLLCRELTL